MGSDEDFTAYAEGAWTRLFRTAYALTGDPVAAEELMQATLVTIYVQWRRVRRADSRDAYVRRIMVNQAMTRWRSRAHRSEVLTADPRSDENEPGFEAGLAADDEMWTLVQGLPPRQRAVLVLRYYEDLSEGEIAATLGIARGTVKSLASAAITKLRGRLEPKPDEARTGGRS